MIKKVLGFTAFILTGLGLVVSVGVKYMNPLNIIFIGVISCFFAIGVKEYIEEMKNR
jgi:hypothetical protein